MKEQDFNKLSDRLSDAGGEIYAGTIYRLRNGNAILYVDLSMDGRHYTRYGIYTGVGDEKEVVISLGALSFEDVCHIARIALKLVI